MFVHTLLTISPGDQTNFSLLVCQSLSGSCPIYFLNPVSEQKGLKNGLIAIFKSFSYPHDFPSGY